MKSNTNERFRGKRILFATFPAEGHFYPLTGLAKSLEEAGCEIAWYTTPYFASQLKKLSIRHFPYVKARNVNSANLANVFPERENIEDAGQRINFDMLELIVKRAPECFDDIKSIREVFAFDLLICDSMFPATPLIKHALKIPTVTIGIQPLGEESVDLAPFGMGLLPAQDEATRVKHMELREAVKSVIFTESIYAFDNILKENGVWLEPSMAINLLIKSTDLYLQIGAPGLEYHRSDLGKNIRYIGALLPYIKQAGTQQWFDDRVNQYEQVVLVTMGTVEKDVEKLLVPVLEAFKGTGALVIATTGNSGTEDLSRRYPQDNFIIEDYLPFNEVMPYADVFISNGGYGGVLLGIENNLPLVVAGVHEGKNEICARIGYFNYGVNLNTETPTPEAVRDAVVTILADPTYKENIGRLREELKTYDAYALCFDHIASFLGV